MFGYRNLKNYENEMNGFLLNGGTLFMVSSLTKNQVEDGILNETFGLEWKDVVTSSDGEFYNPDDVTKTSHRIKNYFLNISGDATQFKFTAGNKIGYDERTIIIDLDNPISHVKVNELAHGRTVWFAEYEDDDINNLLKAVVLWASGERYGMNLDYKYTMIEKLKSSEIPYTEASYLTTEYEVRLKTWGIFY